MALYRIFLTNRWLTICQCDACGFSWITRFRDTPRRCANQQCKTIRWNRQPGTQEMMAKLEVVEGELMNIEFVTKMDEVEQIPQEAAQEIIATLEPTRRLCVHGLRYCTRCKKGE